MRLKDIKIDYGKYDIHTFPERPYRPYLDEDDRYDIDAVKKYANDLEEYNLKWKEYMERGADPARNKWVGSRKDVLIDDLDTIFEFKTLEERELLRSILLSMEGNPADSLKCIVGLCKAIY